MTEWLPEMLCVSPWRHDTYDFLYGFFCQDIRDHELRYCGYEVWIFPEIDDEKEKIFWHLTSRTVKAKQIPRRMQRFHRQEQTESERLPDLRRCERLPWVKTLIEHPAEPEVLAWDYEEGDSSVKTYIWVKDQDFVVIMKKIGDGSRRLITSFYIDSKHKRIDFERKYKNRTN